MKQECINLSDEIIQIIKEFAFVSAPIRETSNLYTDIRLDSLSFVRLLLRIEETYAINFNIFEMEMCLQLDRLIGLVERKIKESEHDSAFISQPTKPRENCPDRE